ncbi:MAG: hypothetical protein K2Q06_04875, partial [Parvularculaceae bacterium]|nr:hypothetical protein [Parvularculaceae bacterium]
MKLSRLVAAACAAVGLAFATASEAATIVGGDTRVRIDPTLGAALTTLGVSVAPLGTATSPVAGTVNFPITGGTTTGAGVTPPFVINHA